MNVSDAIYKIRSMAKLSQEQLASMLGVTRQAVQKWESGAGIPDLPHLIQISKRFGVSLDSLIFGSNARFVDELPVEREIKPALSQLHRWERYSADLGVEYRQSEEEGYDIEQYKALLDAVEKMPDSDYKEKIADVLFELRLNLPKRESFTYNEPSDYGSIVALCNNSLWEGESADKINLYDKVCGAWYARIAGCLLGKTVEGIITDELHSFLKESGNWPMYRYIESADVTDEVILKYKYRLKGRCFADTVECAPCDDDTNYTVLYQDIIDRYGRDFTSFDVAKEWLDMQPKDAYCTAERVAFCNLVKGYRPPNSAIYKNPYREWIGAQIRGDYFGYINPGDPKKAAEMAWRDAAVSHVKNGIYGEMFAAAMIACAAVENDIEKIILGALSQVPTTSRLYEKINEILEMYRNKQDKKSVFGRIHTIYDERNDHDWCHTISNAMIVVAALLYGGGDYGKSVCMAVETGFDTDCNGATIGSVLGMRNGYDALDKKWFEPIHGYLDTSIFGIGKISVKSLVDKTMKHIENR